MKIFHSILVGGALIARLHALDSAEITTVAKRFDSPNGDEQYKARIELNRLVAQATLPEKGDPSTVTKLLVATLQSPETSKEAAKYLLRALSRIGTVDAVGPLTEMLANPDPMLREEARAALSWIRSPQAAAALEAALAKCTDKRAKLGLFEALAHQKAASSVAVLERYAADGDPDLARASMDAIARIGGKPAVSALTALQAGGKLPDADRALLLAGSGDTATAMTVYQSTTSAPVKLAAFIALMKNAPVDAKRTLIETALKSEDAELRENALARGIEINLPSLLATLAQSMDQMPGNDRLVVLANLQHLKPEAAAEKIAISRMSSTDGEEQIGAIAALGKFTTDTAFKAVLQALGSREPRINQAAANSLATLACPAADTILSGMLKGDSSPDKILAVKAMVFRQVPDAGKLLLEIIRGADKEASKEAMKSLYFTASIDDLRALCATAAATPDADLKKSLVSICSRIATRINTVEAQDLVKSLGK